MEEQTVSDDSREDSWSRADAYFDILAHDVTNLISPIMVHAEFISLDKELPRDVRVSAARIVRLIRRTANFIMSFRMLHEVASNPPRESGTFDLNGLAALMRATLSSEYPFKKPSISVDTPSNEPLRVVGADYLGRILMGFADNAVRNASKTEVEVQIIARKLRHEDGHEMLRFEVIDDGPGIPDDLKAELVVPFESSKRLARRSPSSLMFYSAILERLGGRMMIEDRIPGDMRKGTRAIAEIPVE
ncbi:MAG: hypothetical protein JSU93_04515 [Methanobacteriota archaeon]|nr:MAG: hypothetical protein JSU93_04515 [Euryarchaeota archaeon]